MCGRFYIADDDRLIDLIRRLNELEQAQVKTGEVRPGDTALVFVKDKGIQPCAMKWGFPSQNAGMLINARSETASQKPMFADAFRTCRIVVPATSYFEWDASKRIHEFTVGDAGFYLAGLFRPQDKSFVILTRSAAPGLKAIHDRMPVIFRRSSAKAWLDGTADPERVLYQAESDSVKEIAGQMRLNL